MPSNRFNWPIEMGVIVVIIPSLMEPYLGGHFFASIPRVRLVGCGLLVVAGYFGTLRLSVAGTFPSATSAASSAPSAETTEHPAETPDSPDTPDGGKADLGPQPVLLWDRVARPIWNVCRFTTTYPLADTLGPTTLIRSLPFHVDPQVDVVAVVQPTMLTGVLHRPHGPPTLAAHRNRLGPRTLGGARRGA
jgi:hypothetical protein